MVADWIPLLTAGAGLLGGLALRRRRPAVPKSPEAICPCEHSVAFHEAGVGRCHGQERRDRHNKVGDWTGYEYVPCACQHYAGPELISPVTMRPVVYREVTTDIPAAPAAVELPQEQEENRA